MNLDNIARPPVEVEHSRTITQQYDEEPVKIRSLGKLHEYSVDLQGEKYVLRPVSKKAPTYDIGDGLPRYDHYYGEKRRDISHPHFTSPKTYMHNEFVVDSKTHIVTLTQTEVNREQSQPIRRN